jgi:hypothetical protein
MRDPVVKELLLDQLPLNRKNYLEYAGLKEPLDPEVEAEVLPAEFQNPSRT